MKDVIYHGSKTQNSSIIKPHVGTHGQSWVYATNHFDLAAIFIANIHRDYARDLTYFYSQTYGFPVIREKFKGAFELAYGSETSSRTGSIYTLPSKTFKENMTSWPEDLVSDESVKPLEEFQINDVYNHLIDLERQRKLFIIKSEKPFTESGLYAQLNHHSMKDNLQDILTHHPSLSNLF